MTEYGQFCPVALATDVVADRWTPLIVRELVLGNTRFNEIARGLPGISRTLLTQRLRHLERKGVLDLWPSPSGRGNEYHLTPAGKDLFSVLEAMAKWSIEWLYDDLRPDEVEPQNLMWWLHRRLDQDRIPPVRTIVEFVHTAPERKTFWLVLDGTDSSVCLTHPGADSDVVVTLATPTLGRVFQGYTTWRRAITDGEIQVEGPPKLTQAIPSWFLWSPFAETTLRRTERAQSA